ncbi:N-acetyltransferase, partial [Providencia huaxiensis]
MRKVIKSPKDCSETDLKLFKHLVNENGEVSTIGLDSRILNAENLIFIYDDQDILTAVGAIKRPNARYKSDVFEKVGYSANI